MTIHRRSLLKGMLAGATLTAFGLPQALAAAVHGSAGRELVLDGAGEDSLFAAAARSAGVAAEVRLGALPDAAAVRALFAQSRGRRLLGLMPPAAYVLFAELGRDAGVRQVFEGRHGVDADTGSRHVLHAVRGFRAEAGAEPLWLQLGEVDAGQAWEHALGWTLARLAAGAAEDPAPALTQAFTQQARIADAFFRHDSTVSFVMDL